MELTWVNRFPRTYLGLDVEGGTTLSIVRVVNRL